MSAVVRLEMTPKQLDLIRRTVASDCNPEEFDLFIEVSRRVGLDPFRKQIHAVVYNKDKPEKRKMSIITGIDGFRAVAERSGKYRPDENEPEIIYDDRAKDEQTNPLGIERAIVTAYKFGPDSQWHPIKGVAYWTEFAPLKEIWRNKQPTGEFELPHGNWRKMPRTMISKVAEAQALRKGWPEDLAGVYSAEEMERATVDATASELAEQAAVDDRLKRIGGDKTLVFMWAPGKPLEGVPLGDAADRCIEFLHSAKSAGEIEGWRETNAATLNDFWARAKTDFLGVKKFMEQRVKELSQ
jgi:phage recombination protein Bet